MERAIIVRGNLSDPRHIVLDEPIVEFAGRPVEVTVRSVAAAEGPLHQLASVEQWQAAFHEWVAGHDRSTPLIPSEALRREAMYEDPK